MIKLSRRMQAVASLVRGKCVCEIGCDHGKILSVLVLNGKVKKAVFADVSAPSLKKAEKLASKFKLKNCEFIVSDGFNNLGGQKFDTAIIAGMGGKEITKIISHLSAEKCKQFVLQPNKDVVYLRQRIIELGFKVLTDFVICDKKKFYFVLKIEKGSDVLTFEEELLGRTNLNSNSREFNDYLLYEISKCEEILKQTQKNEIINKLEVLRRIYERRNKKTN